MIFDVYWQGFKRSLVTYSRIPLKVDWSEDIKHISSVCFLPWVGLIVALISAWPLWFDFAVSLQALLMIFTAVLLTGGFHEDGLMDACDGLIGGWEKEQRLTIMKDSRIGSYAALSIWLSLMLKWLLLQELLISMPNSFFGFLSVLSAWCLVHTMARLFPLVLMNLLEYVSTGQSKAASMIAKLSFQHWFIAILPCVFVGVMAFPLTDFFVSVIFAATLVWLMKVYLFKKIAGFNGDTLGASEQVGEIFVIACLLISYS